MKQLRILIRAQLLDQDEENELFYAPYKNDAAAALSRAKPGSDAWPFKLTRRKYRLIAAGLILLSCAGLALIPSLFPNRGPMPFGAIASGILCSLVLLAGLVLMIYASKQNQLYFRKLETECRQGLKAMDPEIRRKLRELYNENDPDEYEYPLRLRCVCLNCGHIFEADCATDVDLYTLSCPACASDYLGFFHPADQALSPEIHRAIHQFLKDKE